MSATKARGARRTQQAKKKKSGPRVLVRLRGDQLTVDTVDFLGDAFSTFRAVIKSVSGRFDSEARTNRVHVSWLPDLLENLRRCGMEPVLSARAKRALAIADGSAAPRSEVPAVAAYPSAAVGPDLGPLGPRLFGFQRSAVRWLRQKSRRLLSLPMGAGKTLCALAALPPKARALVVCPASVKGVWEGEAATWRPDLVAEVLAGRGSFRWPGPGELVILNPELLPDDFATQAPDGVALIADEVHFAKNVTARRSKRFRTLAQEVLTRGGVCWGLTGTPLLSTPEDLWGVIASLGLARSVWDCRDHFAEDFDLAPRFVRVGRAGIREVGEEAGELDPTIPQRLRSAMLRRNRAEILPDLPTKRYQRILVELSAEERRESDEVVRLLLEQGVDLEKAHVTLEKVSEVVPFKITSLARAALAAAKTNAALQLAERCEDSGDPLVVFSAHRAPVEALGSRPGWGLIVGDTPPSKRTEIVRAFQAGKLRGIAGTIQAMGVGLTLTAARFVAFVDLSWTPAENAQAEDRVCRIGQTRGVVVFDLVADHVLDRQVAKVLGKKRELIEASVA